MLTADISLTLFNILLLCHIFPFILSFGSNLVLNHFDIKFQFVLFIIIQYNVDCAYISGFSVGVLGG